MSLLLKASRRAGLRLLAVIVLLTLLLPLTPSAVAARTDHTGKVIIFVVDQVNLKEINGSATPTIKSLIKKGSVGLASVHSASNDNKTAQYLSIGAGNKAVGLALTPNQPDQPVLLEGFNAKEKIDGRLASDIYAERTGRSFSPPQAANLSVSALIEANQISDDKAVPGVLGDALQAAGFRTAAIGNADTGSGYNRSIIDIVMDRQGLVDFGSLGTLILQRDTTFPSGYRTDPDKLYGAFAEAYGQADVIAVEWGDTTRVRADRGFLSAGRESMLIEMSLARADSFLKRMLDNIDLSRDLVIIMSPTPSDPDIKQNSLVTPVVMTGYSIGKGLLTSASTRRQPVIINTDIAPTILRRFDIKQPMEMTGRPAYAAAGSGDTMATAIDTSERWVTVRNLMPPILRAFAYWDIFILALFIILLFVPRFRRLTAKIRWLLLTIPAVPLVFLILPMLKYGGLSDVVAEAAVLITAIVALVYWQSHRPMDAPGIISLSVTLTLLIDLATGTRLMQDSLLGYSVMSGARFYGIGNEFSGVLIGGAVISAFYIASFGNGQRTVIKKVLAIALLVVAAAMMGASNLGAEFGSFLAAIIGFGLMSLGIIRDRYGWRDIALLSVLGIAGIAAFVGYDLSRGVSGGSHVGRLAAQIQGEGLTPLYDVINRKVAMNVRLIQFAFWNWVNIASATALVAAFYGLKNLLKLVFQRYPYFRYTMIGGLFCCVGALVFNDSGVVAMAMIFLYLVPTTLFLMTYELNA